MKTAPLWKPTERNKSAPFEPAMLPEKEKEDLCRGLLDEFGLDIRRVYRHDDGGAEAIIPCRIPRPDGTVPHSNQDADPTGGLNFSRLTYHCVGCGASGGLLWFISTMRECSTKESRDWLNGKTGLGGVMELADLLRYFDNIYDDTRGKVAPLPRYDPKVLAPWEGVHPYLTEGAPEFGVQGRHIREDNLAQFGVGYAPSYRVRVGGDDKSPRYINSERITIPHWWDGNLVGWQARRLSNDGTPKYVSSPDFPKDRTIFNYNPRQHRRAIVVEAPLSVVKHEHQAHMVATFSATVTRKQMDLLARYDELIFWMDNDNAGWDSIDGKFDEKGEVSRIGMGPYLTRTSVVYVVDNPYAADPCDLPDGEFLRLSQELIPYSSWERPTSLSPWEGGP